jgi:protein TonB
MKRTIIFLFFLILSLSIKAQNIESDKYDCILPIEWLPEFKGGQTALKLFLAKHLKYPNTNICVNGKVYVQFIVEKDGRITHPIILKSLAKEFDKEALRVIRLMPKWIPARDYGGKKPIATRFTIPIKFEIEE